MNPTSIGDLTPARPHERWALVLLGVSCVIFLALGFFVFAPQTRVALVKFAGCWLMAITVALFVWSLVHVLRRCPREWLRDRWEWFALATIPIGAGLLLAHEPRGFKIIMDEIMLLGTSMSMHFDRLVQVPMRGHDLQGAFVIVDGIVDKRPYFFPFLVSLVHAVAGYRPENAFVVNAILAFLFLLLVYVLGRAAAGRIAAVAGVLLFSGLPLLAQCATGGGFDLLNVLMIAVVTWLVLRFVETRGRWELTALCFSGVLLAQTRYESVLYLFPCAVVVAGVWWRQRRIFLSWPIAVAPIFLLPLPWVLAVFETATASWEMGTKPGTAAPFSFAYVGVNLQHATRFFFSASKAQPNSLLFSLIGVVGVVGFLAGILRLAVRRTSAITPASMVLGLVGLALLAHLALLMGYFWGKFDDPVISRLSLPVHLLFLVALWQWLPSARVGGKPWIVVVALACIQLWTFSVPGMASHAYTLQNVQTKEVEWRRTFMSQQRQTDYLVIDPYSVVWLTHKISSTSPAQARLQPEAIAHHLRARSFASVFVFQRFEVEADTGRQTVRPEFDLGRDFVLETVVECRLQPYSVSRISRVTEVVPRP